MALGGAVAVAVVEEDWQQLLELWCGCCCTEIDADAAAVEEGSSC